MADNKKFWLVWQPAGYNPRFQHASEAKAQAEAEQLADREPGRKFYVLEAKSVSQTKTVQTTELVEESEEENADPFCDR